MAQGQDPGHDPEERSPADRVHNGRLDLLRDEGGLRGHQRQEELGSHRGRFPHPQAHWIPGRRQGPQFHGRGSGIRR